MKLLLDECVDQLLRHHLTGHKVETVGFRRWNGVKNGELLGRAAKAGFDALVTTDRRMPSQQNSETLPLSVVVIASASNDFEDIIPLIPNLLAALPTLSPRSVTFIEPATPR
ncbi:MAG: hypothetical protein AAF823_16210 [Planctomycetota bacterium]